MSSDKRREEIKDALELHRVGSVDGVILAYCERPFRGHQLGTVSLPNNEQFQAFGPDELLRGPSVVRSRPRAPCSSVSWYVDVGKCELLLELPLDPPIIALFPDTALVVIARRVYQYDLEEHMVLGELPGAQSSSIVIVSSHQLACVVEGNHAPTQPVVFVWNLATRTAMPVQGLAQIVLEVLANDDKSFFVCERQRVVQIDTNSGQPLKSIVSDEHPSVIADAVVVGLDRVAALVGNQDTWNIRTFEFGERRCHSAVMELPWRFYPEEGCLRVIDSQYVVMAIVEQDPRDEIFVSDQFVVLIDVTTAVIVHWFRVDGNSTIEFVAWNHTLLLVEETRSTTLVQGFDVLTKLQTHDFTVPGEWIGVVYDEFCLTWSDDKRILQIRN